MTDCCCCCWNDWGFVRYADGSSCTCDGASCDLERLMNGFVLEIGVGERGGRVVGLGGTTGAGALEEEMTGDALSVFKVSLEVFLE